MTERWSVYFVLLLYSKCTSKFMPNWSIIRHNESKIAQVLFFRVRVSWKLYTKVVTISWKPFLSPICYLFFIVKDFARLWHWARFFYDTKIKECPFSNYLNVNEIVPLANIWMWSRLSISQIKIYSDVSVQFVFVLSYLLWILQLSTYVYPQCCVHSCTHHKMCVNYLCKRQTTWIIKHWKYIRAFFFIVSVPF